MSKYEQLFDYSVAYTGVVIGMTQIMSGVRNTIEIINYLL